MERQFGAGFYEDGGAGAGSQDSHAYATAAANGLPPPTRGLHPFFGRSGSGSGEGDSDAGSVFSSDEDVWGAEIGGVSLHLSLERGWPV
jgi:chitin synthase